MDISPCSTRRSTRCCAAGTIKEKRLVAKARYIMIGGLLGAGKTTAILQLAQKLHSQGTRVSLITNDQSFGLVDTALLTSQGMPVEEMTGGGFWVRFRSLVDAAGKLAGPAAPDAFSDRAVGACTALRGVGRYALRRLDGVNYELAPLNVLVDPLRAGRFLGLETGKARSEK